jgi:hypothetical protein
VFVGVLSSFDSVADTLERTEDVVGTIIFLEVGFGRVDFILPMCLFVGDFVEFCTRVNDGGRIGMGGGR